MILVQPKNLACSKPSFVGFLRVSKVSQILDGASLASHKLGPLHFIEANLSFWQNYKSINENKWCRQILDGAIFTDHETLKGLVHLNAPEHKSCWLSLFGVSGGQWPYHCFTVQVKREMLKKVLNKAPYLAIQENIRTALGSKTSVSGQMLAGLVA